MSIVLKSVGEFRNAIKILRQFADGFDASDGFNLTWMQNDLWYKNPNDYRHFLNPLTKKQREKIARYYDVHQRHAAYKGFDYQYFADPKELRSAQKAVGMKALKGWRGVFVPQPSEKTPPVMVKIKRPGAKHSEWIIEYPNQKVDTIFVPFDQAKFAKGGADYVRDLFRDYDPRNDYRFAISLGYRRVRYSSLNTFDGVIREIESFISIYRADNNENDYFDFMDGLHVYRGGGWNAPNKLKKEHEKTVKQKRAIQQAAREQIKVDRAQIRRFDEKKMNYSMGVRDGVVTKKAYRKFFGEGIID